MPKLKNMPISATSLQTHGGKLKFSTLLTALNGLPDNELAVLTHFLQTRGSKAASNFVSEVKKSIPADVFKFVRDKEMIWDVPFPPNKSPDFTFIDLFAGIGGMRLALQGLNGKCVFSSEWDQQAQITYRTNFGEVPFGDITKIDADDIQKHDVLVAGFPCQAFSYAGNKLGFEDIRPQRFLMLKKLY